MPKIGKNIYKRKDGRWEGRYAKCRNSSGRIVYGYVYGKTCSEVKQRLASVATSDTPKTSVTTGNTDLIFSDLANQWLSVTSLKIKPSTHAGYLNTLNLHILPCFGCYKIQSITTTVISCFAKEKLESGRTGGRGGLSPKTVRDMLSIIKAIMDFAWGEKLIANQISVSYPKQEKSSIRVLSRQEQSSLEAVLKTDLSIHKMGIWLCLYTGLRIGEICALRWQDISPTFDTLSVHQTLQRMKNLSEDGSKTKIHIDTPKSTRSIRSIPVPKSLSNYLCEFASESHIYFLSTSNTAFTEPRTMQNHFTRAVAAANISDTNYHALRHTFATRCIEAGVDVKSLSEILGHANVNITLNRYVHPSFDQKRESMNKLEQYIGI